MPSDDLLEHAKSYEDFYALLGKGVHPGSADSEIRHAYRFSALKLHPDKNKDDPSAVEKFHALQIAFDVLSDPAAKAAYDNARLAKEAKRRQREVFEGRRRGMVDDLERRESGASKRKREDMDAEEALERELRRLQEDGRRRRLEREQALKREAEKQEVADESSGQSKTTASEERHANGGSATNAPEIQRTVKARWLREGTGQHLDRDGLNRIFERFGKVESTVIMKDRKIRLDEGKKKQLVGNGVIVFSSVVGAHAAVEDARKQNDEQWSAIESVEWAEGREPDFSLPRYASTPAAGHGESSEEHAATPKRAPHYSAPRVFPGVNSNPSTPLSSKPATGQANGNGLRKVPSFASFGSAKFDTPKNSPFGKGIGSPSLEEITLIRLKNAEKKRLEEKIRQEEAEAAAKEATGAPS